MTMKPPPDLLRQLGAHANVFKALAEEECRSPIDAMLAMMLAAIMIGYENVREGRTPDDIDLTVRSSFSQLAELVFRAAERKAGLK